jgi:P4 family phage/plasmid primase-like protien
MNYFNKSQLKELEKSAISLDIAELNIVPLEGDRALDTIFHALGNDERRNDGRVSDKWLKRYDHVRQHGGLAFYGVNPSDGERLDCISFKPSQPISPDRKYENPPKASNRLFYPAVNYRVWKLVSDRYGVPMPKIAALAPPEDEAKDFWLWVINNLDIPIIITEGCKKALSAISAGFVCVAVLGIWNGTIADRDENGKTTCYRLIPSLKPIVYADRTIQIAYDRDSKAKTIKAVAQARSVLAKLLIEDDCLCYSIKWDSKYKGLDDLIAECGVKELEKAIADAQELTGEELEQKHYIFPNILAEQIVKEWKGRVCYDISTKKWKVYSGGVWQTKEAEEIENLFYLRVLDDMPQLRNFQYVVNVVRFAKCLLSVGKWDEVSSLKYLPFNNGVWSFADRVLLPHDPKYRLSWKLDRDYSPVAQDWDAIDNFLDTVTNGDPTLKNLLVAACAAVLQGRADLHKALYLFGGGRNGKGAFMRLLELLVGENNRHSSNLESLCENRFEISNLLGKRLVVCADEDPRVKRFSMFKKITGGDYLRGEDKGCKAFNFLFHGMVVLASNKPVFIGDDSYGLSDRLIPIPFSVTIPKEQRRDLEPEFKADLPAFTTYLLNLDRQWVTRILLDAKELKPIQKLEWELSVQTDSIAAFFDDKLIADPDASVPAAHLFKEYQEYCSSSGLSPKHINNFCPSLVSLCRDKLKLQVDSKKTRTGKVIEGLRLRRVTDPFGDDCDGVTAVTTVTAQDEKSNCDGVTTVTAVTTEKEFLEKTEPKPPTQPRSQTIQVNEVLKIRFEPLFNSYAATIYFSHRQLAKQWREYFVLVFNVSVTEPAKGVNKKYPWDLMLAGLNHEQVEKLKKLSMIASPPERVKRRG